MAPKSCNESEAPVDIRLCLSWLVTPCSGECTYPPWCSESKQCLHLTSISNPCSPTV